MITAVYARRDEPQELVDGLRENLAWCDRILELQTPRIGPWPHHGQLNAQKRELAGDGWTLFVDPDERLQDGAGEVVREFVGRSGIAAVGMFPFREMWTPTQYRTDGWFGTRGPRKRLCHLHAGQQFPNKRIHSNETPLFHKRHRVLLDCYLYHLKCIEPGNRVARAAAYVDADPTGRWLQSGDWSQLYDETGLELADIEPGRGFSPPYRAGSYIFTAPGR